MSTSTNRKFKFIRVITILTLLLVFGSIAMPAGAKPPEEISFDISVTYALSNFTSVNGVWSAEGLFESTGEAVQTAHHAGWPGNGWQFQTAHFTTTLADDNGTITIEDQSTQIDWAGYDSTGSGHWVLKHGTGAYAGLHGQGTSTFEAIFHFSCPDASVAGPCIVLEMELNGQGH